MRGAIIFLPFNLENISGHFRRRSSLFGDVLSSDGGVAPCWYEAF